MKIELKSEVWPVSFRPSEKKIEHENDLLQLKLCIGVEIYPGRLFKY